MTSYGFLIKEFSELAGKMILVLGKERNGYLEENLVENLKVILRKVNRYTDRLSLLKREQSSIKQDLVLWLIWSVSLLTLLLLFHSVYQREALIRSLLFTLTKFKGADIDVQLEKDRPHVFSSI